MITIILNRPEVLNSLSVEMIRLIRKAMDEAAALENVRWVLFRGAGDKGFCAGGDIKTVAQAVKDDTIDCAGRFFKEEYALDFCIHNFPKPVIVLADGITMGGGLGLCAGADVVVATERSRMAMPESRIGFFPDVGATGWMFLKCPSGYPEYLGLTGYELIGAECVRVGMATHFVFSKDLPKLIEMLEENSNRIPSDINKARECMFTMLASATAGDIPQKPEMDDWVRTYFTGRTSVTEILKDLSECSIFSYLCDGVVKGISERSPTSVVLTLKLLRHNEGRPLENVFENDMKAMRFIVKYPDFIEGVRARLVEKDDNPKWKPGTIAEVGRLDVNF